MDVTIIDPNKPSSFYIWDTLFRVSIPQLQTTSPTYIRMFGSVTSGDTDIDKELSNQPIITFINIAKMVEYFTKGVPVRVLSYKDTKIIYDYIEHHIHTWKKVLENGVNIGDAPIEDLIEMDRFASTVYIHAKHLITKEEINSFLVKNMMGIQAINKFNIIKPLEEFEEAKTTVINAVEEDEEKKYAPRESLIDVFKKSSVGARKWR